VQNKSVVLPTHFTSQDDAKEKSKTQTPDALPHLGARSRAVTKKQRKQRQHPTGIEPLTTATQFTLLTPSTKSTMYEFNASSIGIDHSQQIEVV